MSSPDDLYAGIWVGFGMKSQQFFKVTPHPMNRNHLRDSATEYYFPDEIWEEGGLKLLGKKYKRD